MSTPYITVVNRLAELLSRLDGVRQRGSQWEARCPAHPDNTPSLSITIGRDGGILLKCFAKCDWRSILAALNLPAGWVMPDAPSMSSEVVVSPRRTVRQTTQLQAAVTLSAEDRKRVQQAISLYQSAGQIEGGPGAEYLEGRGISLEMACMCGVRYHPGWALRLEDGSFAKSPAAVFPMYSPASKEIVAVNARFINPAMDTGGIRQRTRGLARLGIFAVPGASRQPEPIITEAPIDAMSLAMAGYPAFATCGTGNLRYFPELFAGKAVLTAFDMDSRPETQDNVRRALEAFQRIHGSRVVWIKPPGGKLKDWNDVLCTLGAETLGRYIRRAGAKCDPLLLAQSDLVPYADPRPGGA